MNSNSKESRERAKADRAERRELRARVAATIGPRKPSRARITAVALAVLTVGAVKAATIGVDTVSIHLPAESYLSGVNPGAYVRLDNGATFGAYRNSFHRASVWAGYTTEAGPFALTLGAISGYQLQHVARACTAAEVAANGWTHCWDERGNSRGAIGLLVAPSVRLPQVLGITPRLTVLPKFSAKGHTVLHLSVEHAL